MNFIKIFYAILICIHGLIHILGFIKAYKLRQIKELTHPITKTFGLIWLSATILFLLTAAGYILHSKYWWIPGIAAVIFSQFLIFRYWSDARFGTFANLIILAGIFIGYGNWRFENAYNKDVAEGLMRTSKLKNDILTESDLRNLPPPVQNYLKYAGVVGKPKVRNMKIEFSGEMREPGKDWFPLTSEQYNFFDDPERLFFMKASINGWQATGYHKYSDRHSAMMIKLLSLFPVSNIRGEEMFISETVTLFNDMCVFAPATLIDHQIQWKSIDENSVRAFFTNEGCTISAILYFNEKGQLINFVTDDRYDVRDMKKYRFSTPVDHYMEINGNRICTYGEAVWHYPDGPFTYGKFNLKTIEYNVSP